MAGKKIMVFGTFDYFHPGHEFVLEEAMKRGKTVVIVARDMNVQRIKRRLPDQSEHIRREVVAKRYPAAAVHLGDPDDFLAPIRTHAPDLILLGYDQALPPGVTEKILGVAIERLPAHKPEQYKSSIIKKQPKNT